MILNARLVKASIKLKMHEIKCNDGYSGTTCNIIDQPCSVNPCQNGGNCNADGSHYTCKVGKSFSLDLAQLFFISVYRRFYGGSL